MISTSIFVAIALLALWFVVRVAKGRGSLPNPDDPTANLRPVDIVAFRNLVDPDETEFLRANLSPADFRKVQRERLRAAVAYITGAAENAAVLLRVGEAARRSPDSTVAEAGEKLVDSAIRLRLYAFQTRARLYLGILIPAANISPVGVAEGYERMTGLALLLGRLQYPSKGAQLSAAL